MLYFHVSSLAVHCLFDHTNKFNVLVNYCVEEFNINTILLRYMEFPNLVSLHKLVVFTYPYKWISG